MRAIHRHAIIVPVEIVPLCNEVAVMLGIDPEGTMNTLAAPMVPTYEADDAEASHCGACGCISEVQRLALEAGVQAGQFPGSLWWRWDELTGELMASHDDEHLGEAWSWELSLAAAGLKMRRIFL